MLQLWASCVVNGEREGDKSLTVVFSRNKPSQESQASNQVRVAERPGMGTRAQGWAPGAHLAASWPSPELGQELGVNGSIGRVSFSMEGDGRVDFETEPRGDKGKCGHVGR